jgi:N-acetylglucosamine kinase-like BadF-type ATPase
MNSPDLYAGIDGGATSTTCAISDSDGNILGVATAGPSNWHNIGVDDAVGAIRGSLDAALNRSGYEGARGVEVCVGLAGLDSPKDVETMTQAIDDLNLTPKAMIVNDWRLALAGSLVDEAGVMLNAGTGSVAAGQDGAGRVLSVGGWGNIIDDRGSAYDIGREALYAAVRQYDGRGPDTLLLGMIMERLSLDYPRGLVERVYVDQMSVSEIASLCTLVAAAASKGDFVARRILRERGLLLAELALTTASRLGILEFEFKITLHGGVFKAGSFLTEPLRQAIAESAPLAKVVEPVLRPECGGIVLLMQRRGAPISRRLLATMKSTRAKAGDSLPEPASRSPEVGREIIRQTG